MKTKISNAEQMQLLLRRLADVGANREVFARLDLSPAQAGFLNIVERQPGIGVQEIADSLGLTPPTVSVAVRKLVKAGLLEQGEDPEDKRARPLHVTPAGDKKFQALQQAQQSHLALFLSGLETEEQQELIRLLDKAAAKMEEKKLTLNENTE